MLEGQKKKGSKLQITAPVNSKSSEIPCCVWSNLHKWCNNCSTISNMVSVKLNFPWKCNVPTAIQKTDRRMCRIGGNEISNEISSMSNWFILCLTTTLNLDDLYCTLLMLQSFSFYICITIYDPTIESLHSPSTTRSSNPDSIDTITQLCQHPQLLTCFICPYLSWESARMFS